MSHRRNLTEQRFGRLTVLGDSGNRTKCGEIIWVCQCDCGVLHHVSTGNLVRRSVRSCGCLARELASLRGRSQKLPPRICKYPGCGNTTEKGGHGYCGMHAQRVRRYGNPEYVTPNELFRIHNRNAQISRFPTVKATTYRKLYGRHEHRVVAEKILGRPIGPDEHVHHLDGNKQNNNPENLLVLSAKDHIALHAKLRRDK